MQGHGIEFGLSIGIDAFLLSFLTNRMLLFTVSLFLCPPAQTSGTSNTPLAGARLHPNPFRRRSPLRNTLDIAFNDHRRRNCFPFSPSSTAAAEGGCGGRRRHGLHKLRTRGGRAPLWTLLGSLHFVPRGRRQPQRRLRQPGGGGAFDGVPLLPPLHLGQPGRRFGRRRLLYLAPDHLRCPEEDETRRRRGGSYATSPGQRRAGPPRRRPRPPRRLRPRLCWWTTITATTRRLQHRTARATTTKAFTRALTRCGGAARRGGVGRTMGGLGWMKAGFGTGWRRRVRRLRAGGRRRHAVGVTCALTACCTHITGALGGGAG